MVRIVYKMRKRCLTILLMLVLLFCSVSMAATNVTPVLTFSGTTANCSVTILAKGKAIDATLELWQGSTLVDSWHGTGISLVTISGTHICTPGITYTLTVTGTIGSQSISCTPVSGSC